MHETLEQAYNLVQDLVPDYEWTTIIKSGDLIHIPTKTVLSCDIDGYELAVDNKRVQMYDTPTDLFVDTTTDPTVAVTAFVVEAIHHLCVERLNSA